MKCQNLFSGENISKCLLEILPRVVSVQVTKLLKKIHCIYVVALWMVKFITNKKLQYVSKF